MDSAKLVEQRYQKFRSMGKFKEYSPEEREALTSAPVEETSVLHVRFSLDVSGLEEISA